MLRLPCAVGLDGWSRPGVTDSRTWQTSWGRSISGVYDMPEPGRWGFGMLGGWLPGFGPHWSGSAYLRGLLDCRPAVLGSMIENQLASTVLAAHHAYASVVVQTGLVVRACVSNA